MNSKLNASKGALEEVKTGMVLGLGSGTTVKYFIELLGQREDKDSFTCITTSFDSKWIALKNGLKVVELDQVEKIDLAVDGADVATRIGLLKGGGGALTLEKIVAYNAERFIVIVDESKIKENLQGKVVIEVLPKSYSVVMKKLEGMGFHPKVRIASEKLGPTISDNGNFLLDVEMEIINPKEMEKELNFIPGIMDNGIFTKFDKIIIGNEKGFREY